MNWQQVDKQRDWEAITIAQPVPVQQCWHYGEVMEAMGAVPLRLVLRDGARVLARVQLIERKFLNLATVIVAFRGPLWADGVDDALKKNALGLLAKTYSKWRREFLILMPEDDEATHPLMRALSMRRIISGYSTIWVALDRDVNAIRKALNGKWRNTLVKAEGAGFDVSIGGRKPHQYAWLLDHEEEQRERVGYVGLPVGVVDAFKKAGGEVMSLTVMRGREKLAGGLFLLHEGAATYFVGWNGDEGRKVGAHNFMMWQALLELKERGITHLDLGGVTTSSESAGLARFKLGLGSKPVTLAGSYL
ncbi:MAG: peptidoglycan bridge formation glycyltransferase FemA/FemB family protein [Sphingomonadales bacterium]|nr:peptidoglycan bridge formation glycyltransferase FemA/FemB family protein [Sphingomonadales bacterium]